MLKYCPWLLQQLATRKKSQTLRVLLILSHLRPSSFSFLSSPFHLLNNTDMKRTSWNIMKRRNIFWEPIRRSESGFDFKGIVSSCWFLYFDVICHQTHFIDGLVVLFLWKGCSCIEAFCNGVISKCLKWTLAFHKWKNMDICVISIFRILDGVAFHKKQHFLILCYT